MVYKVRVCVLALVLSTSMAVCAASKEMSGIEARIEAMLQKMSLQEKIGQTAQHDYRGLSAEVKEDIRAGRIGSFFNVTDADAVNELQRIAVEESPNGIPILVARDVIHGFKTIFPIPLGQAAGWNPEIVERGARIAAMEATSTGIRWTFAPMVDISRDPRWGRIAESFGEDPYLSSVMAQAMVRGFQGDDLSDPTSMAACVKHFAGYGAAEGGRDYNTVYIPEGLLRNVYLRPFHAAAEAGAATFMTAFNDLNGTPASAHDFLLSQVLRDEWKFEGFVVSDYNSITEMVAHGYAVDERHAASLAMNAGVDMEMASNSYEQNLAQLIDQGKVSMAQLDASVRRILRIKFQLGLFDNPYVDKRRRDIILNDEFLQAAKQAAIDSMVLLKNENKVLPLSKKATVAVIGPLADAPHEQLGTWIFDGEKQHSRTPLEALRKSLGNTRLNFAPGLAISRTRTHEGFAAALKAAKASDVVLFFGGEESILSGEAHSRSDISLPGAQEALITELSKTGKPVVLVILAGRPVTLSRIIDKVDAVLMAWHPGTMAGPAVADILLGEVSPSGRLPVTWPKTVGQIPLYYNHKNTGRPAVENEFVYMDDIPVEAVQYSLGNTSHYLDTGFKPQFPFGHGLTYSEFEYGKIQVSAKQIKPGEDIEVSAVIRNRGKREATEVVQLYVRDVVGTVTRPVRELKGFQRITLKPGESETVRFVLNTRDLAFYNREMRLVTEPGLFNVWIAPNADAGLQAGFEVLKNI